LGSRRNKTNREDRKKNSLKPLQLTVAEGLGFLVGEKGDDVQVQLREAVGKGRKQFRRTKCGKRLNNRSMGHSLTLTIA